MAKVKFPHFSIEEAEVLERFQETRRLVGDWSYDVRLKSIKAEEVKIEDPVLRQMWEALTAKRIDAVCETREDINIIEVKRVMLPSGIGQLMLYSYMYNQQFKPTKPVKLWLIAKYHDPDIVEYCKMVGIKTWWMI